MIQLRHDFTPEQKEKIAAYKWLTDRERFVFDLYYRKGWRIAEIAAVMRPHQPYSPTLADHIYEILDDHDPGMSVSAVKHTLSTLRKKIAQIEDLF